LFGIPGRKFKKFTVVCVGLLGSWDLSEVRKEILKIHCPVWAFYERWHNLMRRK